MAQFALTEEELSSLRIRGYVTKAISATAANLAQLVEVADVDPNYKMLFGVFNGRGKNLSTIMDPHLQQTPIVDEWALNVLGDSFGGWHIHHPVFLWSEASPYHQQGHRDYVWNSTFPRHTLGAVFALMDNTSVIVWPGSHRYASRGNQTSIPVPIGHVFLFELHLVHAGAQYSDICPISLIMNHLLLVLSVPLLLLGPVILETNLGVSLDE